MSKNNETVIKQVVEQHAEIWDRHDMTAYAELFANNADLVNIRGGWWQGRAQIEERMTVLHKTLFRESQIVPSEIEVRFLQENVAIVHVLWELTGILDREGQKFPHAQTTITTWTITQKGDKWQIEAFHNTEVAPPPPELLI